MTDMCEVLTQLKGHNVRCYGVVSSGCDGDILSLYHHGVGKVDFVGKIINGIVSLSFQPKNRTRGGYTWTSISHIEQDVNKVTCSFTTGSGNKGRVVFEFQND
jgi:hypothetical protein